MVDTIRILIADDHPMMRRGLSALIISETGLELVGEAADGIEAIQMARSLDPDVILMDLVMPRKNGLEAIQEIKQENPQARILVLTSFAEDDKVFPAIKSGALGYLLKDASSRDLIEAIRNVYEGEAFLHPTIARKLMKEIHEPSDLPPTEGPLTAREVEVLKLVARGMSTQEIAEGLTITDLTVRTHIRNILGKLHLANRTQAALYALREGLIDLEQTG